MMLNARMLGLKVVSKFETSQQRARFRRKSLIGMNALQREHAATTASYTGSPEHKLPHARSDATLCPAELEGHQTELTLWLRDAIAEGNAGGFMEGAFPRYVWYRMVIAFLKED
jgi:hypothetical protein